MSGPQDQRGSGAYVLCESCNTKTGSWYGNSYVRWAKQAMELLPLIQNHQSLSFRAFICPLNILKEIVCMMCSVNSPEFSENYQWVRRFVLNRHSREWDPRFRIYMNFNITTHLRLAGSQGILKESTIHIISEVVHPPFTYVMTHDSPPPSDELVDITFFRHSLYDEMREFWFRLPVVNSYTCLPADYRSKEDVRRANE